MEIVDPYSGDDQEDAAGDLDGKLVAVTYSDQVVGYTDEIEQQHGAEHKYQLHGMPVEVLHHVLPAYQDVYPEDEEHRKEDGRFEGNAAQPGDNAFMYLAGVVRVEQSLAE